MESRAGAAMRPTRAKVTDPSSKLSNFTEWIVYPDEQAKRASSSSKPTDFGTQNVNGYKKYSEVEWKELHKSHLKKKKEGCAGPESVRSCGPFRVVEDPIESRKYTEIEDYGVIGNLRTSAHITKAGSIDWFCFPYFDSPSVFGRILDARKGGYCSITPKCFHGSSRVKQLYLPNTNVLVSRFLSEDGVMQITDFMPLSKNKDNIHPWLVRQVEIVRGETDVEVACFPAFNYARTPHTIELFSEPSGCHQLMQKEIFAHAETQNRFAPMAMHQKRPNSVSTPTAKFTTPELNMDVSIIFDREPPEHMYAPTLKTPSSKGQSTRAGEPSGKLARHPFSFARPTASAAGATAERPPVPSVDLLVPQPARPVLPEPGDSGPLEEIGRRRCEDSQSACPSPELPGAGTLQSPPPRSSLTPQTTTKSKVRSRSPPPQSSAKPKTTLPKGKPNSKATTPSVRNLRALSFNSPRISSFNATAASPSPSNGNGLEEAEGKGTGGKAFAFPGAEGRANKLVNGLCLLEREEDDLATIHMQPIPEGRAPPAAESSAASPTLTEPLDVDPPSASEEEAANCSSELQWEVVKKPSLLGYGVRAQVRMREAQKMYVVIRFACKETRELCCQSQPSDILCDQLLDETMKYWRDWTARCCYRGRWREQVLRSALALKLMTFEPTGAIIASPSCSLPESFGNGRNWDYRYCWIRDAAFTLYGLMRIGFTEEAEAYMRWMEDRCAEIQSDGSLQIMYGIDGRHELTEEVLDHLEGYRRSNPVRIGNHAYKQFQMDIYGELMDAVYLSNKYCAPISYEFWCHVRKLLDFVCENYQRKDYGIWEVRGGAQHFVYSKMMCWVALDRGVRLADKRSFPSDRDRWTRIRDRIYEEILEEGWSDKLNSFQQAFGRDTLDASNLLMPLVFFMSPNDPRMLSTMDAILKPPEKGGLTANNLCFRYNVATTDDGLTGEEGTFSICSFWLIEAMSRAGRYEKKRLDDALIMFEQMVGYANHLGLYSEQVAKSGELLGNFPQAFTHLAEISAAFNLDRILDEHH